VPLATGPRTRDVPHLRTGTAPQQSRSGLALTVSTKATQLGQNDRIEVMYAQRTPTPDPGEGAPTPSTRAHRSGWLDGAVALVVVASPC